MPQTMDSMDGIVVVVHVGNDGVLCPIRHRVNDEGVVVHGVRQHGVSFATGINAQPRTSHDSTIEIDEVRERGEADRLEVVQDLHRNSMPGDLEDSGCEPGFVL